jgi:hypothetical protein
MSSDRFSSVSDLPLVETDKGYIIYIIGGAGGFIALLSMTACIVAYRKYRRSKRAKFAYGSPYLLKNNISLDSFNGLSQPAMNMQQLPQGSQNAYVGSQASLVTKHHPHGSNQKSLSVPYSEHTTHTVSLNCKNGQSIIGADFYL